MRQFSNASAPSGVTLSVVCAMRNVAHCVDGLLQSYRLQQSPDTQLVVVDAASTDGTWEILLRHQDIIDVALSEPDRGVYDAWNKALRLCAGRYVSFIGADDRLADGTLVHLVDACKTSADDPHLIAGFNILTRNAVPVSLMGAPYNAARIDRQMMIAHVMSAHRSTWLASANGFDASYRSSGDYELLLRQRAFLRVRTLNVVLAFMEDGGASRVGVRPLLEDYRARRKNGVTPWLNTFLAARALVSVAIRRLGLRR